MAHSRYTPTAIWRSIRIRPRLYLGALAGVVIILALPHSLSTGVRWTIAWNAGGLAYMLSTFHLMNTARIETIRKRASRQDDGRTAILVIILLAIAASFGAIASLINEAKTAGESLKLAYLALAALTIFVSWTVTQISFTLHYAHEYYTPTQQPGAAPEAAGGLVFPADNAPDFWDFFYFATSIGATSQTSDVSIKSKALRRLVIVHAVVSFFFNTTVLALTINLAASLI
jgi:uncharacterized membrane protein